MDGVMGLHGWQWMYLGEGIRTALIGITVWFYLTERPSEARWLTAEEPAWLDYELPTERKTVEASGTHSIWPAMGNPKPDKPEPISMV